MFLPEERHTTRRGGLRKIARPEDTFPHPGNDVTKLLSWFSKAKPVLPFSAEVGRLLLLLFLLGLLVR